MNLVSPDRVSSVDWIPGSLVAQGQQPLRWHKVKKRKEKQRAQLVKSFSINKV